MSFLIVSLTLQLYPTETSRFGQYEKGITSVSLKRLIKIEFEMKLPITTLQRLSFERFQEVSDIVLDAMLILFIRQNGG